VRHAILGVVVLLSSAHLSFGSTTLPNLRPVSLDVTAPVAHLDTHTSLAGGKTVGPQSSVPPVVDWTRDVSLPDDILFARHAMDAKFEPTFLVTLDAAGKVTAMRPIVGFSLYLSSLSAQVRQFTFSPDLAGKTFVLRIPDPLSKYMSDWKKFGSEVCTPTTDLRTLYQLGVIFFWRLSDSRFAEHCYKYILDKNPSSVAARWGVFNICRRQKDRCDLSYLQSLVASNPDFIEARENIIENPFRSKEEDATFAADLGEILKLDIPPAARVQILSDQLFWLEHEDRIDSAIPVIKQFNAAQSELLAIYPPAVFEYYVEDMEASLLEEAKGFFGDAIATYRIAGAVTSLYSLVPDMSRYEIDLGLARALRKSGNPEDAEMLCNKWSRRWKKLVNRPVHHAWELREDGVGELEGRWEFSCGSPAKGLQLIEQVSKKYPDSSAPYTALAQYYYSIGEIEKARAAEATASRLLQEWADKVSGY